ncbi:MAG: 50S ribosomal protein L22 [Phycisphaerales bacterium]
MAKYTATYRWARSSERKTGLIVDLIRGRSVPDALNLLEFSPRRAAWLVKKALSAAIAEAEQNDAAVDRLFVSEARVDKGLTIKRFQPKDRGRAHPIQKRTCHITISVEEEAA